MSITKDYLERLNTEVGIAPAGSQEELDCAHKLADEFAAHGLAPEIQDISAPALGKLPYGVVLIAMFVGLLLAGLGNLVLTIIGIVLVFAAIILLGMTRNGKGILAKVGPRAHSQNVIGFREASVEPELRNRPIVVVAHYDTGRIDPLARPQIASVKKYLASYSMYLMIAVAACAIIQLLVFLPEPARRTFWVIGLVAALPLLIWGVCLVAGHFTPYTTGAVDNKSSVAAMLGVMNRVTQDMPAVASDKSSPSDEEEEKPAEPEMRRVVEEVVGTRHGEQVIRELGILPETCSITYIEPEVRMVPVAEPAPKPAPAPSATSELKARSVEDAPEDEQNVEPQEPESAEPSGETRDLGATAQAAPVSEEADVPADEDGPASETRPMEPIAEPRIETAEAPEVSESSASVDSGVTASMAQLEDGQSDAEGPLVETDHSGLFTMAPEDANDAADATRVARPVPDAVADPDWGKSSYKPTRRQNVSNVARRAALFDLPDPKNAGDGLGSYPAANPQLPPRSQMAQRLADASQQATRVVSPAQQPVAQPSQQDDIQVLNAPVAKPVTETPSQPNTHRGLSGLFGRKHKQQESMSEWLGVDDNYDAKKSGESIGSWDNFDDDSQSGHWKGGAALNVNLRKLKDKLPSIPGHGDGEADQDASPETSEQPAEQTDAAELPLEDQTAADTQSTDDSYTPDSYEDVEAPAPFTFVSSASNRDLRDSILAMGDDDLKTHDIWFVATGASNLNNAGASEFVAAYRKNLRGATVINLDCVGAGDLAMLTQEGFGIPRRADRRFVATLESVADDLHLALAQVARPWANTDATMFMRRHLRSVTIMGMDAGESRACAGTSADAPESVNYERVEDVVALVLEAIRRA